MPRQDANDLIGVVPRMFPTPMTLTVTASRETTIGGVRWIELVHGQDLVDSLSRSRR